MNQIINFANAKKRYIPSVVYVGDLVEWEDFNGSVYEGIVSAIEHLPLEGFSIGERLDCFPLWEKEDYSVYFKDGLNVAGSAITNKIIRKGFKVKKPFQTYTYAN